MTESASIPVSSGDANTPATELQLPISDININLIRQQEIARHADAENDLRVLMTRAHPYTIGQGDVLQINVWDHPELVPTGTAPVNSTRLADPAPGFVVDQLGNIQFPYVGTLHVADLRPDEAQARLLEALSKSYKEPQLTLRVASFRAKDVYVDGEVKAPGLLQLNDIPMTLLEAVNRAGGFSLNADQSRLTLLRAGISHPISLTEMLDKNVSPASIMLQAGDVLRVPGRDDNGIFVMGEVNKPALALPMKTGKLTLSQALAQAGSINSNTADAKELYVIRGIATDKPQVFHLNAHNPVAMTLASEFELLPKDVVYVDGNGLVRLSRILSLLLPAYNAGIAATVLTR
ncbi:sugar ABC transporter substrate-binding protein [Paraburkholderia phytofirmans OLGA172]|uniref:Sugar ABC transporter substrate-binding protein n=2 Tax=Paraburkholderia phytofirmans TaxID=261302 RepID=A0A160FWP8_9BURK|nr:sugar ABC transporter substrate-binding protein [Paraburkholderia phytofirmans OLGA172]